MPDRLSVPVSALQPDYHSILEQEATKIGVPLDLAHRIVGQESKWDPNARSPKGAIGLMQLMPGTAVEMGVDPNDPVQNIRGGLKYFKQQLDSHNGDPNLALAAYNAGPGAVAKAGGVPNFKETKDYIQKVNPPQQAAGQAGGRITVPIGEVQRISVPLADLQDADTAEGANLVAGYKAKGNVRPTPTAPGAPPKPSSFEKTGPQEVVTGLRRYSVLPTLGSMAGGTGGAALGGPSIVGIGPLAVAGAGVGASAGEAAQMGLERAVGLETGPPVPRILREGAYGAAGEGIGGVVMKGVTKVAAPFAKKVTTEGLEAMRSMGGKVLPSQATESRVLDLFQNVAEPSLGGGGKIRAFKQEQDKIVEGLVDRALTRYGGRTASEDAGTAFVQGLEGQIDTFHQYAGQLYKQLDQAANGVQVSTADLKVWAAKELQRRSAVPALSGDSSLKILEQITKLADTVPFEEAQVIRSQALAKGRSLLDPDRDVLRGITEQITKYTDTAMEAAARQAGPQVEQAFRTASAFYKAGKQKFETDFLRGLIEKEPEDVAKALMRNNSPTLIREARTAVPAKAWKPVQAALATNVVERATNVETGSISGRAMLTQIKTLGASAKEVFPTTLDEVKRLARVLSTVQQKQGEGTGRMYIQLAQGGAVAGLLTGAYFTGSPQTAAAGGLILLGPVALAKIMTSPQGIRWLTTGLQAPKGSEMAIRAASNLATFLAAGPADSSEGPPRPSTVRTSTVQPPPVPH